MSARRLRALSLAVLIAAVAPLAGGVVPNTATAVLAAPWVATPPPVWPTPQVVQSRSDGFPLTPIVGLVTGAKTDPSAVRVVKQVLSAAGVRQIVSASDQASPPQTPITIWVGGPAENTASAAALAALGIAGPASLTAQGYVLGIGRGSDDQARVVLSGVDPTGTFYAAQTLRQLVVAHTGRNWLPGVSIRDWPALPLRGVIEGFYGPPWSAADRLSQFDFLAATKQDVYVYSPKDDPYLRAEWRLPYPSAQLAVIKQLVDRAITDHVQFTYALSPGLSVCFSSSLDEQALVAKLQSIWAIGVRSFAIPLDDISYTTWHCDQDQTMFGTGGAAAGQAQAYLLNKIQQDFIDTHADAQRLEMVPTEYYTTSDSPYKAALRQYLDPQIIVEWTGVGVTPATITALQAQQAKQVFGHDILIWDNYPVNDYISDRLLLGPYVGREAGVADSVLGVTANPMIESEPSKIAEFTSGAFLWNPSHYQATTAWLAGIHYLGGQAWQALKVFAENNYSSVLNAVESPVLAPLINTFWQAYNSGSNLSASAANLSAYFGQMAAAPAQLQAGMNNPAFLTQAGPWLQKLGLYGQAGQVAVALLVAHRDGNGGAAWWDRLLLENLLKQLAAIPQVVAPGVIDPFLAQAAATSEYPFRLSAPTIAVPGSTFTATTQLLYIGTAPLQNVNVTLTAPSGWTVSATSPSSFATVNGGQTVQTTWSITLPAGASPGSYQLSAQAIFQHANGPGSATASAQISVPFPSLSAAFDNIGISDDANPTVGNFDGGGGSLSAQALAAAGLTPGTTVTHNGLTFTWPNVLPGTPNNVSAGGQTIALSGSGNTLGLLGAGAWGFASGAGTITYTDGTTQQFTLSFADWWDNAAAPGGDILVSLPYINTPTKLNQEVSVYYASVPLQQGKTVQYVTLPDISQGVTRGQTSMHVFAVAIE
jgi:hypothetical protein